MTDNNKKPGGMGSPATHVSNTAIQLNRQDLLERGIPEHMLDIPFTPETRDYAIAETNDHLNQAFIHLSKAGDFLLFLRGHLDNETFSELCDKHHFPNEWIRLSFVCSNQARNLSDGDVVCKKRKRLTTKRDKGFAYQLNQTNMLIDGSDEDRDSITETIHELTRQSKNLRRERDVAESKLQSETSRRENAEREAGRLILEIDSAKNILRGTAWPELTAGDEQKLAKNMIANLEKLIVVRDIFHVYAASIREANPISGKLRVTIRQLANLIFFHAKAAEQDLLYSIKHADYDDAAICGDQADRLQDDLRDNNDFYVPPEDDAKLEQFRKDNPEDGHSCPPPTPGGTGSSATRVSNASNCHPGEPEPHLTAITPED